MLEENENLKKQLEQLKAPLQFKLLNNDEIRDWIITDVLKGQYSGSDIDKKAIDIIMKVYVDQENWLAFCKNFPTEPVRKSYILNAYKFNHYYNLTNKLME